MKVREVKKTDNLVLAKLIRKVFEEYKAPQNGTVYSDSATNYLYELFEKDKAILWVAEENEKIVGCCGVYPTEGLPNGYAELAKFYIAKKARGKGFGRELIASTIESALQFGYKNLYLESLPEFSNAVSWYKKLGFKKLDYRLGNSGHSSCNIWMLKSLG